MVQVQGRKSVRALELMPQLLTRRDGKMGLLQGDVIEGPLGSEHATGWVSNVVITGKAWDKDRIRMNLDTRLMADNVKQTHFPIPTCEQLRHEFQGSDRF